MSDFIACDTLDQPEKACSDKASRQDWYQNNVRMDLNSLITKTTKQNELIEQLIKEINFLSSELRK